MMKRLDDEHVALRDADLYTKITRFNHPQPKKTGEWSEQLEEERKKMR